jgi:hypothetical protein
VTACCVLASLVDKNTYNVWLLCVVGTDVAAVANAYMLYCCASQGVIGIHVHI